MGCFRLINNETWLIYCFNMEGFFTKNVIKFLVSVVFIFTLYLFFMFYYKMFENDQISYNWLIYIIPSLVILGLCLNNLLELGIY